jgi:molybdenum cofactor cytidylyltransferase
MTANFHLGGLILAGGSSRRMGQPKALLKLDGLTFLERWLRLLTPHTTNIVIVTGAHHAQITTAFPQAPVLFNPHHADGMFTSLRAGLTHLSDCDRILFSPIDFAAVLPGTISTLLATHAPVVKPRYLHQSGHPVLILRPAIDALLAAPATENAKHILAQLPNRYIDVDDWGVVTDCDTPEDYYLLTQRFRNFSQAQQKSS